MESLKIEKKESIKKNYIYNLIYQILIMIIPLITTPYLSRVLGAENIGIFSYTNSIVTYFILFGSLGISTYAKREIAYVQDNKQKRSKIFWEVLIIKAITLILAGIIYYINFIIQGEYTFYYKILLLEFISNILDISWFFQGMEKFKKVVIRNTCVKIIFTILIFLVIKKPNDLCIYMLIYTMSTFIGNIVFWIKLKDYIGIAKEKLELKKHIKPAIQLLVPQIAIQVYTVLDKVMLGSLILDKSEVGYYEQASKIVRLGLMVVTTLGVVMSVRIANIYAKGNNKEIQNKIYKSFRFVFFLGMPIMFGLIAISNNFVPWFYGEGYDKVKILIKLFSPIIIFVGCSNVIGSQYLIPTKKQNKYTTAVTLSAIANVIMNFILIPKFLSIGATISSAIAELIGMIIQYIYIYKEFRIKEIFKHSIIYLIASAIMGVIIYIIGNILESKIINSLFMILLGGVIYIIILILFKEDITINGIKKIKEYIYRDGKNYEKR